MAVIAVVIILVIPAIKNALAKRDLTRVMNNGRELYLAAFRMATDGAAKSDTNLAWPGDYPANNLAEYCGKLIEKDYVKPPELQRMLSALKIYKVKGADPSNTIFAASLNYVYDTELNSHAVPFGEAEFVIVRKAGDAGIYRAHQATTAGFENNAARFQSDQGIGALPGALKGNVVPGDNGSVLAAP